MADSRACPACNSSSSEASIFMEENIDASQISEFSFASRKAPEWMCHRLVRCQTCSLVYAPTPPSVEELAQAYHQAAYDSNEEANDAAKSYMTAISPALRQLKSKESALEIGTGTGIFLEYLSRAGFASTVGVEPSMAAIESAPQARQSLIRHGIFKEQDFAPESFDLICCFMTLEHVQDPMALARSTFSLLRKGGAFVCVTHDYQSLVNRFLGKRSPIIDIEHMQLFSKQSAHMMLKSAGFSSVLVRSFTNSYSLQYWLRLSPIPKFLKRLLAPIFASKPIASMRLGVNVGNIVTMGFKV